MFLFNSLLLLSEDSPADRIVDSFFPELLPEKLLLIIEFFYLNAVSIEILLLFYKDTDLIVC